MPRNLSFPEPRFPTAAPSAQLSDLTISHALHCRTDCSRAPDYEFSHQATFDRLLKDEKTTEDAIYQCLCSQVRLHQPAHAVPSP